MTFYLLNQQITTVFLKLGMLTSLSFQSPIQTHIYGGKKSEIYFNVVGNAKTLVIKPNAKNIASNLIVLTKSRKYYFNLKSSKRFHKFIEIKDGKINSNYQLSLKTKNLKVFTGATSTMVVNRGSKKILINESELERKGYFSKGVPIFFKGKRIFN